MPKVGTNALDAPLLAETRAHGLGSDVRSPRNAPEFNSHPKAGRALRPPERRGYAPAIPPTDTALSNCRLSRELSLRMSRNELPAFERRGMNPFQKFASRLKHGIKSKRKELGAVLNAKRAELDAKRDDLVVKFMQTHELGAGVYAPNKTERRNEKANRKQESAREAARGAKVHLVLNSIKVADVAPSVVTLANTKDSHPAAKDSTETINSNSTQTKDKTEKKEKKAPNSAVFGPKLTPQKVTVADLKPEDRAILGIPLTARNMASAAMFAFAVYSVSKAVRKEKTKGDTDDAGKGASKSSKGPFGLLDLDSAFTTSPAKGNTPRQSSTKAASPAAEIVSEAESTSRQLMDQLERVAVDVPKAAAEMLRNGLTPAKKKKPAAGTSGGKRAVKRVNPAVVKARRMRMEQRLASSGRLVAKVLGVSLASAADSVKGAAAGVKPPACEYSVRIECRRGDKLMGGVTSKRKVGSDGTSVEVRQKMRFNLPAAKDEGEITLRLCDAKGKTVARSGLTLVDVLRVSPVTKDFQLFGRDMRTFANARLAFTWEPNA